MTQDLKPITRALLSVTDKQGITALARALREVIPNIEIIASGGTAKALAEDNVPFTLLRDYTGYPECFGGRLKTLHPLIAGGILMKRDADSAEAGELGIKPIDLVVCNLYNFEKASQETDLPISDLIESMDIGGSTLIRSACKNYHDVTLVVDPADYSPLIEELKHNNGTVSLATRERYAVKGINTSADYEALLAKVLTKKISNEETQRPRLRNGRQLRYGENPDQKAWVYHFEDHDGITNAKILAGKELSYNNYEDATVAYNAGQGLLELEASNGVAIVKHGSLCAYATGNSLGQAFILAWQGDSKSAFGSVIALTVPVKKNFSEEIRNKFIEVIIAPGFDPSFVEWSKKAKPNLRLLQVRNRAVTPLQYKNISGGMLVQTRKEKAVTSSFSRFFVPCSDDSETKIGIVTKKQPEKKLQGLYAFGIAAVNFAKSNAVAIVREPEPGIYQLIGMGSGQPNRVDSLERLAIPKAVENLQQEHDYASSYHPKEDLEKCVIASDGFFPFDDSVRYAAKYGLKNCIQPGGSKRDQEVIHAADELDICMIFTGERYFYH